MLLLLAAWLLFSCGKNEIPPVIPPVIDSTDNGQYGTPFSNVTDREDAVIYQVNIRAFSTAGNFQGVIDRLDSIKALGVNVIYLMPIYPLGALNAINSPYCIKDYLTVNTEFGTLDNLRALVDGAHNRNMSVILDWVGNHTSWDHTWIGPHPDWYLQNSSGTIISPPGTGWNDVAQLNFDNADMRLQMISAMKYWVYQANIDGFRCDFADGPPADFWTQAIDTLRDISTHKLLLLAEGTRAANFTSGFDFNFGFNFYDNLKTIYSNNVSVLTINTLNISEYAGAVTGQQVVRYTTNHDVNGSDGTPLYLFKGENGSLAAFAVVAFFKSVPMIYSGQEVGMTQPITFPFTGININWNSNPGITPHYKKIIAVRNNLESIRRGSLSFLSDANVCAFKKELNQEIVFVIINMRNQTVNYSIPSVYHNTSWTDQISDAPVMLGTSVSLEPYEYLVLKK
ncbi:MAG: alpha-amylase family glycosyl hydrolase [Chitinophagales bacterium]